MIGSTEMLLATSCPMAVYKISKKVRNGYKPSLLVGGRVGCVVGSSSTITIALDEFTP